MSEPHVAPCDVVVVGRIGSAHGVQGWVNIHSFTSPPENILSYLPWFLKRGDGAWQAAGENEARRHKKGFIAHFETSEDRDAAAALTGALIGVARDRLPEVTDPDEYYWRDLIGCRVVNQQGEELGNVDRLLETGANDVLVVVHENSQGQREECLVPFVAAYVRHVAAAQRLITVDWDKDW